MLLWCDHRHDDGIAVGLVLAAVVLVGADVFDLIEYGSRELMAGANRVAGRPLDLHRRKTEPSFFGYRRVTRQRSRQMSPQCF